jgi:hypothetical protein
MLEKKTIVIAIQNGFMARYILRSGILDLIKRKMNIVILTPNNGEEYFVKEFGDENVFIEHFKVERYRDYEDKRRVQKWIRMIRWYSLPKSPLVKSRRISYIRKLLKEKRIQNILRAVVLSLLPFLLERIKIARLLLLRLEHLLFTPSVHEDLFIRYNPSLIVTSSLGYFGFDHLIMREARKKGVKIVSTLLSWDNTSSKGLKGAKADYMIVWTQTMKDELMKHYDEAAERIFVGGIPHFDLYFNNRGGSRENFMRRNDLSLEKKVILFVTRSPNKYPWNPAIIETIINAIRESRFAFPAQLLVRVHPLHFEVNNGKFRYENVVNNYKDIERNHPDIVHFVYPAINSNVLKNDMPCSDMYLLMEMLKCSDVMLSVFSTMVIEGSIFDIPSIEIANYGYNIEIESKSFADQFIHLRKLKNAGKIVYSDDEMIEAINDYLKNPEKDREARRKVVEEACGPFKGRAAERFAELIIGISESS